MILKDRDDLDLLESVLTFYIDKVRWTADDPERDRLVEWVYQAKAELAALPTPKGVAA